MNADSISIIPAISAREFELIESWLSDKRIWKYLGPPFTDGKYKKSVIAFAVKSGKSKLFLGCLDDEPACVVGLSDICHVNSRANCWYALGDTSFGGKGVTRRSCGLVLEIGFRDLNLHSIYAWAVSSNHPSIRILTTNGFKKSGLQREAFYLDGEFVDITWYDLLATEWFEQNRRD